MATKTYYCGVGGTAKVFNHDTEAWTNINVSDAKTLNDIMCFPNNPNKVITVGQRGNLGHTIFLSTNSGTTWANIADSVGYEELFEVWVVDSNTVYTCGQNFQGSPILLRSIDGGLTFTTMPLPANPPLASATAVHFFTPLIGVLAIGKKVYLTTDGCTTWTATNGGNDLLVSGNPIGTDAVTYPHAIGGVQVYPLSNGNYRITVLTDKGVVQSVDNTNSIYTTTFDYAGLIPINSALAYPGLKGTHLTWFGSDYFWITDNWGGIWYSPTGGVTWGNALSNYGGLQTSIIYGAHFYGANFPANEFTGFVTTNILNPPPTFTVAIATKNVCNVTISPNGLQPGTNSTTSANIINAVWTEQEINKCIRLKECNGTKEVIIRDFAASSGYTYLSNAPIGSTVNISYVNNANSPCLAVTDYLVPICWIVEEIIEDCEIIFPVGQNCVEIIP